MALHHVAPGPGGPAPPELEFTAEDAVVEVVPKVAIARLQTLGEPLGPLRPNIQSKVPLWAAVAMRKRNQCRIVIPRWLEVSALEATLAAEREATGSFQALPPSFLETAKLIFLHAREDFESQAVLHRTRSLVEDLRHVRESKLHHGLAQLNAEMTVNTTHISPMEIHAIRPLFVGALDRFRKFDHDAAELAPSQPPAPTPAAAAAAAGAAGEEPVRRTLRGR